MMMAEVVSGFQHLSVVSCGVDGGVGATLATPTFGSCEGRALCGFGLPQGALARVGVPFVEFGDERGSVDDSDVDEVVFFVDELNGGGVAHCVLDSCPFLVGQDEGVTANMKFQHVSCLSRVGMRWERPRAVGVQAFCAPYPASRSVAGRVWIGATPMAPIHFEVCDTTVGWCA